MRFESRRGRGTVFRRPKQESSLIGDLTGVTQSSAGRTITRHRKWTQDAIGAHKMPPQIVCETNSMG